MIRGRLARVMPAPEPTGVATSGFLADRGADGAAAAGFPGAPRSSHGRPQVDDRRVLSGVMSVNRHGSRRRAARAGSAEDALQPPGPREPEADLRPDHEGLVSGGGEEKVAMIDATDLAAPGGLTPHEHTRKIRISEPDGCIVNPIHRMPGPNAEANARIGTCDCLLRLSMRDAYPGGGGLTAGKPGPTPLARVFGAFERKRMADLLWPAMAEPVGFEPTEPVKAQRFSRPPQSTTLPRLRHRA